MPGFTANYAIPYPCSSDTIDPAVFGDWANAIETAIETAQARAELSRLRPRAEATGDTNLPAGVTTPLDLDVDVITHPLIVNGGTLYTINMAGVYMCTVQVFQSGASPQLTVQIVGPAGQVVTRDLPAAPLHINVSGLIVVQAGQTVQFTANSSLLVNNVQSLASVAFICEV